MKNAIAALSLILAVSLAFIGCDFVDDNAPPATAELQPEIDAPFNGFYTTRIDTTGYECTGCK